MLEVGPGTGYYTLDVAEWVGPGRPVDILDLQQEMLDHTMRRAGERGLANVTPTQADATALPYEDETFDAAFLVTVLGEIPDQDAALRELARVLKPGGRLVVGELFGDPHYVALGPMRLRAAAAGLGFERRAGNVPRLLRPVHEALSQDRSASRRPEALLGLEHLAGLGGERLPLLRIGLLRARSPRGRRSRARSSAQPRRAAIADSS